jgi:hypothetical protein
LLGWTRTTGNVPCCWHGRYSVVEEDSAKVMSTGMSVPHVCGKKIITEKLSLYGTEDRPAAMVSGLS